MEVSFSKTRLLTLVVIGLLLLAASFAVGFQVGARSQDSRTTVVRRFVDGYRVEYLVQGITSTTLNILNNRQCYNDARIGYPLPASCQ